MPTLLPANTVSAPFIAPFLLDPIMEHDPVMETRGVLQNLANLADDLSKSINERCHMVKSDFESPETLRQIIKSDVHLGFLLDTEDSRRIMHNKMFLENCMAFLRKNGWLNAANICVIAEITSIAVGFSPNVLGALLHPANTHELSEYYKHGHFALVPTEYFGKSYFLLKTFLYPYRIRGFRGSPIVYTDFVPNADMMRFRQMTSAIVSPKTDIRQRFPFDFKKLWTALESGNHHVRRLGLSIATRQLKVSAKSSASSKINSRNYCYAR